jgi:uncharacterized protein (DUF2336 family)
MRQNLSQADVLRLLKDPSGANRREAAVKIASTYSAEDLTTEERAIAEDILRPAFVLPCPKILKNMPGSRMTWP